VRADVERADPRLDVAGPREHHDRDHRVLAPEPLGRLDRADHHHVEPARRHVGNAAFDDMSGARQRREQLLADPARWPRRSGPALARARRAAKAEPSSAALRT